MNTGGAASLRRSVLAERIRLREEWSELKGTDDPRIAAQSKQPNVLARKHVNITKISKKHVASFQSDQQNVKPLSSQNNMTQVSFDVLHGVVALVSVGTESRALPLRAALTALGASVVPRWSPLVTHVVWAQGGCRTTRTNARALASKLVSPLWVEACASSARRLPEQAFPAAARPSDLPSPRTLRQMLKKADLENIQLTDLFSFDKNDKNVIQGQWRMSSETEKDSSAEMTTDKSHDKSEDIESRVNTAPRRALPKSLSTSPQLVKKSRRKLFTQREAEVVGDTSGEDSDAEEPTNKGGRVAVRTLRRVAARERRGLARAERSARRLRAPTTTTAARAPTTTAARAPTTTAARAPTTTAAPTTARALPPRSDDTPAIVLTGMNGTERKAVAEAIRSLNGRIQKRVDYKTTHVLLGSCRHSDPHADYNITGVTSHTPIQPTIVVNNSTQKPRTLNALFGAVRGCRILYAQWAIDSAKNKQWAHHVSYEVPYMKKISEKARIERTVFGRQRRKYAYDVFNGLRVLVTENAEQKEGALQILKLCGAVAQDGGKTQNGGISSDFDVTVGINNGEVNSKWVFDSVQAGRTRTTRRYINNAVSSTNNIMLSL